METREEKGMDDIGTADDTSAEDGVHASTTPNISPQIQSPQVALPLDLVLEQPECVAMCEDGPNGEEDQGDQQVNRGQDVRGSESVVYEDVATSLPSGKALLYSVLPLSKTYFSPTLGLAKVLAAASFFLLNINININI